MFVFGYGYTGDPYRLHVKECGKTTGEPGTFWANIWDTALGIILLHGDPT